MEMFSRALGVLGVGIDRNTAAPLTTRRLLALRKGCRRVVPDKMKEPGRGELLRNKIETHQSKAGKARTYFPEMTSGDA